MATNLNQIRSNVLTNNSKEELEILAFVIENAESIYRSVIKNKVEGDRKIITYKEYNGVLLSVTCFDKYLDKRNLIIFIFSHSRGRKSFIIEIRGNNVSFASELTYVRKIKDVYRELLSLLEGLC